MPFSFNGVGTIYYGRENVRTRQAQCGICGESAALTSFDTGLFVILVFIPILPLGRKRVIDQCPACRRHHAMPLDEWRGTCVKSIAQLRMYTPLVGHMAPEAYSVESSRRYL